MAGRGLRQVRRWSNWTAAALMAATVVTTGYFARTSHPAGRGGANGGDDARGRGGNRGGAASTVCFRPGRYLGRVWRHEADRGPVLRNGIQRPRRGQHGPDVRGRRLLMALSVGYTADILRLTSPLPGAVARAAARAGAPPAGAAAWVRGEPAGSGTDRVAIAERAALGTTARVASWPPEDLDLALAAVDGELERLDRQASRFRDDSELSRLYREPGRVHQLSPGLAEAVSVALAAARWTGGLVDPTVGGALIALGYDRDFVAIGAASAPAAGPEPVPGAAEPEPVPGWRAVTLEGTVLGLAAGVRLDLGATAKGLGSDRAAAAAYRTCGRGGLLVSLGGDIAVAGQPPVGGWPVAVADSSDPDRGAPDQVVRLTAGALATSSVTGRWWQRDGLPVHHIVDPRTGPAGGLPGRTVSVAAASCAEANAAATAAIVAGPDAEAWLAGTGLPSRLASYDGTVRLLGGWPDTSGGALPDPLRHDWRPRECSL